MASFEALMEHPALPAALVTASTNAMMVTIQQQMQGVGQANLAKQQATYRAISDLRKITHSGQFARLEIDSERSSNILMHQRTFRNESKVRARAARILYQQRLQDMDTEIATHTAAIAALNRQLDMIKAEHAAQHTLFDMLDAHDLQLEDERRLPASAAPARLEREHQRASNAALMAALAADIAQHRTQIAHARHAFAAAARRDCTRAAKTALRELTVLRGHGAPVPKGEHKLAFWNALRRATTRARPTRSDVEVYERYERDLQKPLLEGAEYGMPPSLEVVQAWPEVGEERDGMFSIGGWQF